MEMQAMNGKLQEVRENCDISEDWRIKLEWKLCKTDGMDDT
jgi:hypothetical protein